ncbi:MAG: hypothetical protein V4619_00220 [Bacteroidota bacterium]
MKRIVFLILITCGFSAWAQKMPDFGTNRVRISADDKIIQAELLPVKSDPDTETDRLYYWYGSNKIHITQGGFSGRLLNGQYIEYYLNKNIKEEGRFVKGLKEGVWKNWTENGVLQQSFTWKKGIKQGEFIAFDNKGAIRQQGKYNVNLLNGTVKTIDTTGKLSFTRYRDGKVIVDSPSKFWAKVKAKTKVFRKKTKSPKSTPVPVSGVKP